MKYVNSKICYTKVLQWQNLNCNFLEQCCIENGVPQKCIGLCIEEQDDVTDRFMSICDSFETVIESCTGENIVLQGADQPK